MTHLMFRGMSMIGDGCSARKRSLLMIGLHALTSSSVVVRLLLLAEHVGPVWPENNGGCGLLPWAGNIGW